MVPMPMNNMPLQESGVPHEQAYAAAMPPTQFFMPAHADSGVADFRPPVQMPAQQYHHHQQPGSLAGRHMTPINYHGLPYGHQSAWNGHH